MYQATKALNARTSIRVKERNAAAVIAVSIHEMFLVRMTKIEKLQHALKQLIDLFLADLVRGEEVVQVEVRKSAIGQARGQERPQAAGINGTHFADFLEENALQRIFKNGRIEQFANFGPRPALDQDRAQKAQSVFLQRKPAIGIMNMHAGSLSVRKS